MNKPSFDRRRGPDLLVKWVHWSGIISWSLIIIILGLAISAKPQIVTLFDRFFNIDVDQTWDLQLLQIAFAILVILFIFCIISLFFNSLRSRRQTDRLNKTIIFHSIASLIGIIIFLLYIL